MGDFHCPMGVAFYDDEGCILCEMCNATTEPEMVEASKKIRAYLKTQAPVSKKIRKIAVTGKGGAGKSTISVLVAHALKNKGYEVLVLDTDESNPGLSRLLGFTKEPCPLVTLLERFSANAIVSDNWLKHDSIKIENIPPEFISRQPGILFMMVGKIEDPFQGCACSMADITRDLIGKLVLNENQTVVVDVEAGVESFGRGVERNVDQVLVVVEPSFESMALTKKIDYMARGMGIVRVHTIFNKVGNRETAERMKNELSQQNILTAGTVFYDQVLSDAGFDGNIPLNSSAMANVQVAINGLLDEAATK